MLRKVSVADENNSAQSDGGIKPISRTGSWDRAVIYDLETGNVDIRRKQDIEKDLDKGNTATTPIVSNTD
jgi:hypothetical protein